MLSIPLIEFETIQKGWIREVLDEKNKSESNTKSELPELPTPKQTAIYLGVSSVTLWKWTKEGLLQSYKISGRIRYKREEVLQALHQVKNLKYRRDK